MLRFRARPTSRRGKRKGEIFIPPPAAAARRERNVRPASYVLVSLLFSALLFGIFLVTDHGFLKVRRQRLELARVQAEVSALAAENERLEAEVKALANDPKAVERIAREDLGFARADEIVLQLPKGWQKRIASAQSPPAPASTSRRPAPR
jgi:cell division protein FtsB